MSETAVWAGRTLREWVPAVVDDIVQFCRPYCVILFGSVARGDEGPDSDLDFLVILDHLEEARCVELMGKIRGAISAPVPTDVFVTDVHEFTQRKDIPNSMHYWPAREGEVVYERPPDLVAEGRRWLRAAHEELKAARVLVMDPDTGIRLPAFWCHLAAEKALKGLATARSIPLRKIHQLTEIVRALPAEDYGVFDVEDLQLLDPWQAAGRYPDALPNQAPATTEALVAAAERVLRTAERLVEGRA